MNPKLARLLTRLYPRSWRKRYGAEFEALLESGHGDIRTAVNVAWSALREHILPSKGPMTDRGSLTVQFQSWCVRAPWAMFCLAPVILLAGAYLFACLILWSGWQIYSPGADSPFGVKVHGFANLYFQIGRYCYWTAPVLVGWGIELVAIRQRAKAAWLVSGLVLVAWMGAVARIQASRTAVPDGLGHISMDFPLWQPFQSAHDAMFHALTILSLTVLPYLLWRLNKVLSPISR
jgi:hypothetical protein